MKTKVFFSTGLGDQAGSSTLVEFTARMTIHALPRFKHNADPPTPLSDLFLRVAMKKRLLRPGFLQNSVQVRFFPLESSCQAIAPRLRRVLFRQHSVLLDARASLLKAVSASGQS